jgi:hypothetical protein
MPETNILDLHGNELSLSAGPFVSDLARFAEGILSEKAIRRRYPLASATWDRLGSDDALVEVIETEKARRIRDGSTARERAQVLHADAPTVLGGILKDTAAPARFRIESARELRMVAANGPDAPAPPPAERFQIIINLGGDTLKFDATTNPSPKVINPDSIKHSAADHVVNDDDDRLSTPWGLVEARRTKTEGGDGQPV